MKLVLVIVSIVTSLNAFAVDPVAVIDCNGDKLNFSIDIYHAGHPQGGVESFIGLADLGPNNKVYMRAGLPKEKVVMRGYGGFFSPIYYVITFEKNPFMIMTEIKAMLVENVTDLKRFEPCSKQCNQSSVGLS
jgi:hypothetical protein